jgi:16S rRNA (guanine1207-N2)-methyltransferase
MHALDALSYTLETHPEIGAEGRVLFMRAQPSECLGRFQGRLTCEQPWKPRALALEASGHSVSKDSPGPFQTILLLPERQRESILADIARAHELLAEGGTLVVSLHNDWGAKRTEQQLAEVAGQIQTLSKHHSRVFWAVKDHPWDLARLNQWKEAGAMRRILDGRFWSAPGLFHWDEIDAGSRLLSEQLPPSLSGSAADFGASWGFLSVHLLGHCRGIRSLDCFEADAAALECLRRNVGNVPTHIRPRIVWSDVTTGAGAGKYDVIVMNPPFHDGRDADPLLGIKFITQAASALRTGGELWLVANKHLPYENLMRDCFEEARTVIEKDGFKVLHGRRPQAHVQMHQGGRRRRGGER